MDCRTTQCHHGTERVFRVCLSTRTSLKLCTLYRKQQELWRRLGTKGLDDWYLVAGLVLRLPEEVWDWGL